MKYSIFYTRTETLVWIVEFDGTRSQLEALVKAVINSEIKELEEFPVKVLSEEKRSVLEAEFKVTRDGDGECPVIVKNNVALDNYLETDKVALTSFHQGERTRRYRISYSSATTRILRVEFGGAKSELQALMQALVLENVSDLSKLPAKYVYAEVWSVTEPIVEVTEHDKSI